MKKVYVQGDAPYRMMPEDINLWYVRNTKDEMVPFSPFSSGRWTYGSPRLERYNGLPAVEIQGMAAPGLSSGAAMAAIEDIASKLPAGLGIEWTGLSYQERMRGSQAPVLYAISILVVFLCLAALYESWAVPPAVMLVVPLGVVGAVLATFARGLTNDVFFQVGLLTTIGLAAKNAILIVEFAKDLVEKGHGLLHATMEASRLRLRPILMTSLAFILGVLPLAIASGAGSGSQRAIGTGVIGGMVTATILGIYFVPVFFVIVYKLAMGRKHAPADPQDQGGGLEPEVPTPGRSRAAREHRYQQFTRGEIMRPNQKTLAAVCLAALLPVFAGGCTMAPKYVQPKPPLPSDWTSGTGAKAESGTKMQDWRNVIADEPTKRLVELALANNRDLRVAALNIVAAQAQYQIQRADLLPKIDATAGANMNRTPPSSQARAKPSPAAPTASASASAHSSLISSAASRA
jgi:hypothetical protein